MPKDAKLSRRELLRKSGAATIAGGIGLTGIGNVAADSCPNAHQYYSDTDSTYSVGREYDLEVVSELEGNQCIDYTSKDHLDLSSTTDAYVYGVNFDIDADKIEMTSEITIYADSVDWSVPDGSYGINGDTVTANATFYDTDYASHGFTGVTGYYHNYVKAELVDTVTFTVDNEARTVQTTATLD